MTTASSSAEDKKKIRPFYSELQGYLSQAPTVQAKPYLYRDEGNEWEQVNTVIEQLNTITGNNFDRFKITLERDKDILSVTIYRSKLGGIISYLHGEYFFDEPAPFSGMPNNVITNNLNQQQSQQQTMIVTLLELQSKIDKKLTETTDEKQKSFLQKLKDQLTMIVTVTQLIQQILTLIHESGIDPHIAATLLA